MRGPLGTAWEAGLFARDDALVRVTDRLGLPGGPDAARVVHARITGGFDVEILPSRGLDVGATYVGGTPLSWFSPVADARTLDVPSGTAWMDRFFGGLLTTCGPENLGPATAEHGMHGSAAHLPATDVSIRRGLVDDGPQFVVSGVLERMQVFGPSLRIRRRIVGDLDPSGDARLTITDVLENPGPVPVAPKLLYHLNLGAPLVVPGSTVEIAAGRVAPRDADPVTEPVVLGEAHDDLQEAVFEHTDLVRGADGRARAVVTAPDHRRVEITWNDTLPGCYEWVLPARHRWALGIEPSTAPMYPHARTPHPTPLHPGDQMVTEVQVVARGF